MLCCAKPTFYGTSSIFLIYQWQIQGGGHREHMPLSEVTFFRCLSNSQPMHRAMAKPKVKFFLELDNSRRPKLARAAACRVAICP